VTNTVLAIDDFQQGLDLLVGIVRKCLPDYEVLSATSGREGIALARARQPDAVLLDARMPELDGFEVCRILKTDPETKHIPILMVSGVMVDAEHRASGLEIGADGYICKPFEKEELLAQLKALLRIKRGEDELRRHKERLEEELQARTRTLKESEEQLRRLYENSPDAIFLEDAEGNVLDCNPAACQLHGMARAELVGNNVLALVPQEVRERTLENQRKMLAGELDRIESHSRTKAGTEVPVELRGVRIPYRGREALLLHVRDITARKRVENALRESQQRYEKLVNSVEGIVWEADAETLQLTFVSRRAERLLGYPLRDWTTRTAFWSDHIHDHDREWAVAYCRRCVEKKKDYEFEYRMCKADGSVIWLRDLVTVVVEEGRAVRLRGVRIDITELKRAEAREKATSAGLRAVVEAAYELIRCPDLDTLYRRAVELARERLGVERCAIFVEDADRVRGTYGTDLKGRTTDEHDNHHRKDGHWSRLFGPMPNDGPPWRVGAENWSEWVGEGRRVVPEKGWVATTPIVCSNTKPLAVFSNDAAITGAPFDTALQEVVAVYCSLLGSIIERKRSEERENHLRARLANAKRMESLGLLAGGVAHDLNNILGPLVAYPTLILEELPEDSPLRADVLEIENSAKRAADVIQDLLSLARRGNYQLEPIDVNEIVREHARTPDFEQLCAERPEVEVDTRLADEVLAIKGSRPHLSRVMANLVTNAFEAMPDGGRLTISTRRNVIEQAVGGYETVDAGDYIELRIKDTGEGIGKEDLERIFEPFYTKRKMGRSGTGLGLAVVYGVVRDLGGRIDVKTTVGKGTEFVLYFPAIEEQPQAEYVPPKKFTGHDTVLIVDDVREQRELASRILSNLGYRVVTVASGPEAVRFLRENAVDLVILDMILEEDFDGLDTYREILKIRPQQRCVIASGYAETERVRAAQVLGAGAYIRKPYTVEKIGAVVRQELDKVG